MVEEIEKIIKSIEGDPSHPLFLFRVARAIEKAHGIED